MSSLKRFIQAIQDYFRSGQVGDIAFLKFEILGISANPAVVAQLQDLDNSAPSIDLEELCQLPPGSLGYEYAQHMHNNGIRPLAISDDLQAEAARHPFALRYTLTHDLFHVLLGFDTSYGGEAGVAAFTIAQGYSGILSAMRPVMTWLYPLIFPAQAQQIRANMGLGAAIGQQAACVLAYPFEQNWARPIAEVRAELGLVLANERLEPEAMDLVALTASCS